MGIWKTKFVTVHAIKTAELFIDKARWEMSPIIKILSTDTHNIITITTLLETAQITYRCFYIRPLHFGDRGSTVVEVLCYKSKGR